MFPTLVLVLCSVVTFPFVCTISEQFLEDGYFLDALNEATDLAQNAQFSDGPEVLECPSSNVITTRYKCNMNGEWVDCTRKHCCKDYTFIAGRCVLKDEDPCSMNLCEQQCTVYLQRVICTCYDGYKFHPEHQRNGIKPFCVDVNECLTNNGDCEHECNNEDGDHRCACKQGYVLGEDNRTCIEERKAHAIDDDTSSKDMRNVTELPARRERCYASCDSVSRLHDKLKVLSEKVSALSTAIRLASFASGPPGPAGPPGPPGQAGPRGFPGAEGEGSNSHVDGHGLSSSGNVGGHGGGGAGVGDVLTDNTRDYTYSILDAFVPLPGDETTHCHCKRGPQGPPGAPGTRGPQGLPGERGQRGVKGPRGSFDFLLLVLADLRHDIQQMQSKIYTNANGDKPTKFDVHAVLEQQRFKGKQKLLKQYKSLEAFATALPSGSPPVMEMNVVQETSNRNDPLLRHHSDQMISSTSIAMTTDPNTNKGDVTMQTSTFPTATSTSSTNQDNDRTPTIKTNIRDYEAEENEQEFSGEMTYEDYL